VIRCGLAVIGNETVVNNITMTIMVLSDRLGTRHYNVFGAIY